MFKNSKVAIISLLLFLLFSIFAYWYLNYYLITTTASYPDGSSTGSMKTMTVEKGILLLGSAFLAVVSFGVFVYQIIRRKKR